MPRRKSPAVAASRIGKVHIGAYLPEQFRRNIHLLQAATGDDLQRIMERAFNNLFREHNVPVVVDPVTGAERHTGETTTAA